MPHYEHSNTKCLRMSSSRESLEHICRRPAMYCGSESLEALSTFFFGYRLALNLRDIHDADDWLLIPREFHDWVTYRLRLTLTAQGWCELIRQHTASDREAIDKFFELVSEFHNRQPHLVAKLVDFQKEYSTILFREDGSEEERKKPYPQAMSLVTYTDDPGFFVCSDTEVELPFGVNFMRTIEDLESRLRIHRDQLTIMDPAWNFGLGATQ